MDYDVKLENIQNNSCYESNICGNTKQFEEEIECKDVKFETEEYNGKYKH